MTEHTKGPWRWRKFGTEYYLVADHGSRKVILQGGADYPDNPESNNVPYLMTRDDSACVMQRITDSDHPDLDLIAAAPDLLAALEEVVAMSDRNHDAWDRAKAAIAKAKGG